MIVPLLQVECAGTGSVDQTAPPQPAWRPEGSLPAFSLTHVAERHSAMIIRPLQAADYDQAVDLKISCWDEELAGVAPNRRLKTEEFAFMTHWVTTAAENNDIRLVYGAFDASELSGFAGASIAEPSDAAHGIELNYLFVKQEYRGRGLALLLLDTLLVEFDGRGYDEIIVYNHHYAPSNTFYRKFGGKVVRQDLQGAPLDRLEVDVFVLDFHAVKRQIERVIQANYARGER